MTPIRLGLVVVIVALALTAGWLGYRRLVPAPPPSPAVAKVDGATITRRDLDVRLAQILPTASFHGNIEASRLLGLKRAALDELILDELIYREAVKVGQSAGDIAVDAEVDTAKQRFATTAEYETALTENGMTEAAFRRYTARRLVIRQARRSHADQRVTDADAEAYFQANAGMFLRPERVHLLELLIKVDPANPKAAAAAERKARMLAARIRAGEPFGTVARENSEDEYRVKDGDLGFVHRGRLDNDLENAVFEARPGEIQVVRSLYGFHVVSVVERQPAIQLTFEEARPALQERLTRERREHAEKSWFAALRSNAKVTILDAELRDAVPAELPAVRSVKGMESR